MITLIMVTVVIWTFIRTLEFVIQLWRLADGAGSPEDRRRRRPELRRAHRARLLPGRVLPRRRRGPSTPAVPKRRRRVSAFS